MYILLIFVAIGVLIYQNNRINKLEELFLNRNKQNAAAPSVSEQSAPVLASITTPAPVSQSVPVQTPIAKPVSDEETSGKVLGRIGIAALVIGIGFFIKYAFDNNWVSPEGRILIGLLIGVFVISLGQFLRKKYLNYSDLLIGGGMAILYLAIYSAYGFYHLVDPMIAFMGMIVVTAIGVFLSILNATMTLSVLAFIGGFLTPFIIGPQYIDTWIVFTYITILNMGILGILIYKKFTNLIIVGLVGTWMYFGFWYGMYYNDVMMIPTLIFLFVQYLIFTGSSVIRIIVDKLKATEVDYFVLASTAVSLALICYDILMPEFKHYVSAGSVLIGLLYICIAILSYKANPEDRTINIFLPGLGVAFLTIAVPIEFSGPWIAAWWFVESIVLYVLASKSSSRGFQVMGVIVYICGLLDLFYYIAHYAKPIGYTPFFNGPFAMTVMATVTAYAIAYTYYRYGSVSAEIRQRGIVAFVVIANILTLYAISVQIISYYDIQLGSVLQDRVRYDQIQNMSNTTVSIFWALYAALLAILGFAKKYPSIRRMSIVLFIITAFKVLIDVWSLGELYRIISFIIFGIIALAVSFIYVKYKDRLSEIV